MPLSLSLSLYLALSIISLTMQPRPQFLPPPSTSKNPTNNFVFLMMAMIMIVARHLHSSLLLLPSFLILFASALAFAGATPPIGDSSSSAVEEPAYDQFTSPVATILVALVSVLLLMAVFSICVLHCAFMSEENPAPSWRRVAAARGVDPEVVEKFPTVVYADVKGHRIGEASLECAVCLSDFEDHETLRLIPACDHAFHPDCIGVWLASHTTCPVCRANLAPTQPPTAGGLDSQLLAETSGHQVGVDATVELSRQSSECEGELTGEIEVRHEIESVDENGTSGSSVVYRFVRSHSTGHSLVRPGENAERFTLRLPLEVRNQIMERTVPVLPGEGSSRGGWWSYRGSEGSSRSSKYLRRPAGRLVRAVTSDRWVFHSRMPSFLMRVSSALSPQAPPTPTDRDGGSYRGSNRPPSRARPPI